MLAALYGLLFLGLVVAVVTGVRPERLSSSAGLIRFAGDVFLSAFAILGMRVMLSMLTPESMVRNSRTCMLFVVSLLSVFITGVLVYVARAGGVFGEWAFLAPFLLPYVLAPALATLLLNAEAGLAVGIGSSLLMALLCADGEHALLVLVQGIFASIVTPRLVHHRVRRRMQLVRAALSTSLVLTVGVYLYALGHSASGVVLALPNSSLAPSVLLQVVACLASGFGCALLAVAVLPLLEHLFGATSNITLNSFADLSHPLLYRLANEAPGTSNHSIVMATLSSAAAEAVGANALLARVGAYYHDIGKLSTPGLFIENTTPERNPHRTLKPSTSASWVRSHVKDGVVLAQRYHLPPPVKAILWEHHGTTAMAVFLHKAREQAKAEAEKQGPGARRIIVEESQFRYPGPRPTSRESGIIMLADSVEAAARSLDKPTPSALDSLVTGIVETKLKDGQLDDCPLSLRDLARVKRAFVTALATILHARIPYPTNDETDNPTKDREPADAAQPESGPVP